MAAGDSAEAVEDSKEFGRRLRDSMRRRGITGVELARRTSVSSNTVSGWTTGRRGPDYRHLMRIIQALGATPAELLSDEDLGPSDRLVVRIAELRLAERVREFSAIGDPLLETLEQVEQRADDLSDESEDED
jgi:transcriptional regulator with XRE-family HTH domain